MNRIKIKNQQKKIKINQSNLRKLADHALLCRGVKGAELSVLIVDDAQMRKLNKRFLGKDRPTDVLAFRFADAAFPAIHPEILGDVIISAQTAWRCAGSWDNSLDEEIDLYLVHGILHVLGFCDTTAQGRAQMEKLQKEILRRYA